MMSVPDVARKAWTWNISNLEAMNNEEVKILLRNRNFNDLKKDANALLEILKNDFEIDDPNLNFNQLTTKQIKTELKLRWLSTDDANKKTLLNRLQIHCLAPTDVILVFGYIRKYEKVFKINICDYLKGIVLLYGKSIFMAFYLELKQPNNLFTLNIKTKEKSNLTINGDHVSFDYGLTHSSTAILPQSLITRANIWRTYSTPMNHMIFHLDGIKTSVLLINTLKNTNEPAVNINLPPFDRINPWDIGYFHFLVYEPEEELLFASASCQRYQTPKEVIFKSMSFSSNILKWKNLSKKYCEFEAAVIIKTKDNEKRLFTLSDYGGSHIYDWNNNEWTNGGESKHNFDKPGISYSNKTQRIYAGCGMKAPRRVQCYDLHKQKWMRISGTNMNHHDPLMWNDKINPNILYVSSGYYNGLEYIDFRQPPAKFHCVYVPNNTQSLGTQIGVDFVQPSMNAYATEMISKPYRLCMAQL